jgi:electron transfer flavoprotein beta subunit
MAAKKKTIEVKDAAALGLDAGALKPLTEVVSLELPAARATVKMIEGDPAAQANELIRLLHEEAKVI